MPYDTHRSPLVVDAVSIISRSYASNSCRFEGYTSDMMFLYLVNAIIINSFRVKFLNNLES